MIEPLLNEIVFKECEVYENFYKSFHAKNKKAIIKLEKLINDEIFAHCLCIKNFEILQTKIRYFYQFILCDENYYRISRNEFVIENNRYNFDVFLFDDYRAIPLVVTKSKSSPALLSLLYKLIKNSLQAGGYKSDSLIVINIDLIALDKDPLNFLDEIQKILVYEDNKTCYFFKRKRLLREFFNLRYQVEPELQNELEHYYHLQKQVVLYNRYFFNECLTCPFASICTKLKNI